MNMMEGALVRIRVNAVVMATGGAGRVYRTTPTAASLPVTVWVWR
ncbi:hypothetical protein ACLK1S_25945 [Escherichia coli]